MLTLIKGGKSQEQVHIDSLRKEMRELYAKSLQNPWQGEFNMKKINKIQEKISRLTY